MEDAVQVFMFILHVANLAAAGYAIYFVYSLQQGNHRSFSRTMKIMAVALVVFFLVEALTVFRVVPTTESEAIRSLFSFVFVMLLLLALSEVKKGMMAHDHLMRRKQKQRLIGFE